MLSNLNLFSLKKKHESLCKKKIYVGYVQMFVNLLMKHGKKSRALYILEFALLLFIESISKINYKTKAFFKKNVTTVSKKEFSSKSLSKVIKKVAGAHIKKQNKETFLSEFTQTEAQNQSKKVPLKQNRGASKRITIKEKEFLTNKENPSYNNEILVQSKMKAQQAHVATHKESEPLVEKGFFEKEVPHRKHPWVKRNHKSSIFLEKTFQKPPSNFGLPLGKIYQRYKEKKSCTFYDKIKKQILLKDILFATHKKSKIFRDLTSNIVSFPEKELISGWKTTRGEKSISFLHMWIMKFIESNKIFQFKKNLWSRYTKKLSPQNRLFFVYKNNSYFFTLFPFIFSSEIYQNFYYASSFFKSSPLQKTKAWTQKQVQGFLTPIFPKKKIYWKANTFYVYKKTIINAPSAQAFKKVKSVEINLNKRIAKGEINQRGNTSGSTNVVAVAVAKANPMTAANSVGHRVGHGPKVGHRVGHIYPLPIQIPDFAKRADNSISVIPNLLDHIAKYKCYNKEQGKNTCKKNEKKESWYNIKSLCYASKMKFYTKTTVLSKIPKKLTIAQKNTFLFSLYKAISNVKPPLECRSKRFGGSNKQVPAAMSEHRQWGYAIRWILEACKKHSSHLTTPKQLHKVSSKGTPLSTHNKSINNRASAIGDNAAPNTSLLAVAISRQQSLPSVKPKSENALNLRKHKYKFLAETLGSSSTVQNITSLENLKKRFLEKNIYLNVLDNSNFMLFVRSKKTSFLASSKSKEKNLWIKHKMQKSTPLICVFLAEHFKNSYYKRGYAIQKRNLWIDTALANRAFLHYRWW